MRGFGVGRSSAELLKGWGKHVASRRRTSLFLRGLLRPSVSICGGRTQVDWHLMGKGRSGCCRCLAGGGGGGRFLLVIIRRLECFLSTSNHQGKRDWEIQISRREVKSQRNLKNFLEERNRLGDDSVLGFFFFLFFLSSC